MGFSVIKTSPPITHFIAIIWAFYGVCIKLSGKICFLLTNSKTAVKNVWARSATQIQFTRIILITLLYNPLILLFLGVWTLIEASMVPWLISHWYLHVYTTPWLTTGTQTHVNKLPNNWHQLCKPLETRYWNLPPPKTMLTANFYGTWFLYDKHSKMINWHYW